jgi:hypothetical protein
MSQDGQSPVAIETIDQWRDFVAAFDDVTLPKSAWTHKAHLTVGLWYLLHHPPKDALELLRVGIRRYNEAIGIVNTDNAGYHETLTRFYVLALADFIFRNRGSGLSVTLLNEVLASRDLADRYWPLKFYTRERILSLEARTRWIEPDVGQFPWVGNDFETRSTATRI